MTALVLIGAGLLGGLGAISRFLVDAAIAGRVGRTFPFGTLVVNLSGSFVLGVLVGAALNGDSLRLVGTGFIGAYTTFSTWTLESERLAEEGEGTLGLLNFGVSLILGVGIAWLGREIGSLL